MTELNTDLTAIRSAIRKCFELNKEPLTMAKAKAWIAETHIADRLDPKVVHSQIRGSCKNLERAFTRKDRKDAPKILVYDKDAMVYELATSGVEGHITPGSSEALLTDSSFLIKKRVDKQVTFILERHLRDYLALNLEILESGLELYDGETSSVEYCVDGRFIDILARDAAGGVVVIELKAKKAYDRVIGQSLLYRSLLERKLGIEQVRIILVAETISKELRLATKRIENVSLFEYKLSMQVMKIETPENPAA